MDATGSWLSDKDNLVLLAQILATAASLLTLAIACFVLRRATRAEKELRDLKDTIADQIDASDFRLDQDGWGYTPGLDRESEIHSISKDDGPVFSLPTLNKENVAPKSRSRRKMPGAILPRLQLPSTNRFKPKRSQLKSDNKEGTQVGVWYATNRNKTPDRTPNYFYGIERSDLKYGLAQVRIPPDHKIGALERPSFWRLEWKENYQKHIILTSLAEFDTASSFFKDVSSNAKSPNGNRPALVFVHGFNTTFAEAARTTAQIAYDLFHKDTENGSARLTVLPILFSWPSKGAIPLYPHDASNADFSIAALGQFLLDLKAQGIDSIILMAHSMGNRILAPALEKIGLTMNSGTAPLAREIILAAPDIDAGLFTNMAASVFKTGSRTTIYTSRSDKPLQISQGLNGFQRLGDADPVPLFYGAETVDASNVGNDIFCHSYLSETTVLSDLHALIAFGASASDRFGLLACGRPPNVYWEIKERAPG